MNNLLLKPIKVATPVMKIALTGAITCVCAMLSCVGSIICSNLKVDTPAETEKDKESENEED